MWSDESIQFCDTLGHYHPTDPCVFFSFLGFLLCQYSLSSLLKVLQPWANLAGKCHGWIRDRGGCNWGIWHVAYATSPWGTWWEHLALGNMGGTGLWGRGRYPRHTRCSGGVCRFCSSRLDCHKNSDLRSEYANGTGFILLWYTIKSPVVLMTKSIGIVTPLILRLVVVVALRLVSYTKSPVRSYCTRVICQDHIVQGTWLQWRERERRETQGSLM